MSGGEREDRVEVEGLSASGREDKGALDRGFLLLSSADSFWLGGGGRIDGRVEETFELEVSLSCLLFG